MACKDCFKKKKNLKSPKTRGGRNFLEKTGESFVLSDMYAEPVTLNFRGREKFVSATGSIFSLLVRLWILVFTMALGLEALARDSETVYSVVDEINFGELQKADGITFDQLSFEILVGFDKILTPDIGQIKIELIPYQNGARTENKPVNIDVNLCDY